MNVGQAAEVKRTLVTVALLLAACVPEEGPLMAPNQDCLRCHGGGGDARAWTVAGTFGGRGSRVAITDANGWSFTLHAAENGNFYTAEKVVFPLRVSVDGRPMAKKDTGEVILLKYGGCNVCHGPGGAVLPMDEFMAPGSDCLFCHGGSGIAEKVFSAAGTWSGPGSQVTLTDGATSETLVTNRVGNFFTEMAFTQPLSLTASVDGRTMEPRVTYGGCNRCHPFGRNAGD
jgi:hypothetical protein